MNRAILITAGIVIIIFVLVVWLYLFFNGSPVNTTQIFSDLGIIETSERTIEPVPEIGGMERGTTLSLSDGALQQITTDPVAGFRVASSTSDSILRYVERGTGYIYEVNLLSGLKKQVTPNTMPNTITAHFSPSLDQVVIITAGEQRRVTLLQLADEAEDIVRIELPAVAENIAFAAEDTITYTVNSFTRTVGFTYHTTDATVTERFRVPIPDGTVITTDSGETYVYPKPTAHLTGALYRITDNKLTPLSEASLGLTAYITDQTRVITSLTKAGNTYQSHLVDSTTPLPAVVLSEKCTEGIERGTLWCAINEFGAGKDYLEDWYKGVYSSDDILVALNTLSGEMTTLAVPKELTGRQLDVTHLSTDQDKQRLIFQNKIDASLWLFNLP